MPSAASIPLILVPGLGADARMYRAQQAAFPGLIVPAWLEPEGRETLAEYARRLARQVDPGGPCVVGGTSLGGSLAVEMARHLRARACVGISSLRQPGQLPRRVKLLRPLAEVLPLAAVRLGQGLLGAAARTGRGPYREVMGEIAQASPRFVGWALRSLFHWDPPGPPPAVPIFQIHGRWDPIFPAAAVHADLLVADGGHLLPLTHPREVNDFLRQILAHVRATTDDRPNGPGDSPG